MWSVVKKGDLRAKALAERHYNRQTPGTPLFTPPGKTLVLLSEDEAALWAVVVQAYSMIGPYAI